MNEQMIQSIVSDLGNTIAQLYIDLATERASVKELAKQLEEAKGQIAKLSKQLEETKITDSNMEA